MIMLRIKHGMLHIKEHDNKINNNINSYTPEPCCNIDIRITKDVGAV